MSWVEDVGRLFLLMSLSRLFTNTWLEKPRHQSVPCTSLLHSTHIPLTQTSLSTLSQALGDLSTPAALVSSLQHLEYGIF